MNFGLIKMSPTALLKQHATAEILKMNDLSSHFGLTLTHAQAEEIVETNTVALRNHGRIQLGKGVAGKLIAAFCDSKYLNINNYAEYINELLEIFYCLKMEAQDTYKVETHGTYKIYGIVTDDEIITGMRKAFETICQGSLELLAGREGLKIARSFITDYEPDFSEDHNHEGGYQDDWAGEWEQ